MRDGQFSFEGSKEALENILTGNLYLGLIRKRGEPPEADEIDDETTMSDLENEGEDSYFEENDSGYSRVPVPEWTEPHAPEEPPEGWEGDKPAQITNEEAVEFGPWDVGHIDIDGNPTHTENEEADPDEIAYVFITDEPSGYEGKFIAYYDLGFSGEQIGVNETLRIPVDRLIFKMN